MPDLSPDEPGKPVPFDCANCTKPGAPAYLEPALRESMHCGWIPREEWRNPCGLSPALLYQFDAENLEPVCPGWLARQPFVGEVAPLLRGFRYGIDPGQDISLAVWDGLGELDAAVERKHAEEHERLMKELEAKKGRNGH